MKVLFIQFRQMGDILMTTPALRHFKAVFPGSEIHFLANRGPGQVLKNNPHVDRIVEADTRGFLSLVRELRSARYDAAVDFMGSPRSARWTFLSGASIRVGISKPWRRLFYNRPVPIDPSPVYSPIEKLRLLSPLIPGDRKTALTPILPEIFPGPEDQAAARALFNRFNLTGKNKPVAFAPVSRRNYKRWPPVFFARVCDHLHRTRGLRFLPLFGPGEESQIEAVIKASDFPAAFYYPAVPGPFPALRIVMERCSFYFGNDNGIRHLAVAAGIPTAAVFGSPAPVYWTPDDPRRHKTLWGRDRVADIEPEKVLAMVESLINENHPV